MFRPEVTEISLNEFVAKINSGGLNTSEPLTIKGEDKIIEGKLTDGTSFKVSYLQDYDITKLLLDKNIAIYGQ